MKSAGLLNKIKVLAYSFENHSIDISEAYVFQ